MHAHSGLIRTSHLSCSPLQVHPISGHPNSDCTTQGSLLGLSRCSLGVLRVKNHWASLRGALPTQRKRAALSPAFAQKFHMGAAMSIGMSCEQNTCALTYGVCRQN